MSEIIFCSIQMSKNPFNVLKMYYDKNLLDSDDTGLECILTYFIFTYLLFRALVSLLSLKQVQKHSFRIFHYGKSYDKYLVSVQKLPENLY